MIPAPRYSVSQSNAAGLFAASCAAFVSNAAARGVKPPKFACAVTSTCSMNKPVPARKATAWRRSFIEMRFQIVCRRLSDIIAGWERLATLCGAPISSGWASTLFAVPAGIERKDKATFRRWAVGFTFAHKKTTPLKRGVVILQLDA